MNLTQLDRLAPKELYPGCRGQFVHAQNVTVAHWSFWPDTPLPLHSHPHEQVVNVVRGTFELTVDGETQRLGPGSVVVVPGGTPHSGKAITETYIIDVFYPVREDYR
ncbi:MAG: cupin domain-containing protein [Chloroflexi bacterium]|nr:cupin domain-containing protein [Chloroflexota bacterium]